MKPREVVLVERLPDSEPAPGQVSSMRPAVLDPELTRFPGAHALSFGAQGSATYIVEIPAIKELAPPLVLVHGLGDAGVRDFYQVLGYLSRSRRVILVDLPGLARSELGHEPPSPEVFAKRVNAVIEELLPGRFDLLGHSLGGAVSLIVASSQQGKLRRLVLVDVAGVLSQDAFASSQVALFSGSIASKSELGGALVADVGEEVLAVSQALRPTDQTMLWGATRWGGVQLQAALLLAHYNLGQVIPAIRSSRMVLWGLDDSVASLRTAELLSTPWTKTHLVLLPGVGHTPMTEASARFSEQVLAYLDAEVAPATSDQSTPDLERMGSCHGQDDLVFQGDFAELSIEDCDGVILDRVRVGKLWLTGSEVDLSRVQVFDGVVARDSSLLVTGARLEGEVALLLQESEADVAGSVLRGHHASVQSEGESDLVLSSSLIDSSLGRGAAHGHWVLEDHEGF